jgi:LysR family cys regulon transcriptional activator
MYVMLALKQGILTEMNLKQLRLVREIVRNKFNVTETATSVFASQSGVSKSIKDLEDELGIPLFVRRGKRLVGLTEPGEEVVKVIIKVLLEADNIKRVASQFGDSARGTLTVAATHTQGRYSLPPIVSKFRLSYPDVNLVLLQGTAPEVRDLLRDGRADVGLATDALDNVPDLLSFPYLSWRHVVIASKSHPLAGRATVSLADIAQHSLITYDRGVTGRSQIDAAFEAAGLFPNIAMAALDSDVIKTYTSLGFGVGIIAELAFDPDADRELVRIDGPNIFDRVTTSLAVRRGRHLRGFVYRFIELCCPNVDEDAIKAAEAESLVKD